MGWKKINIYIYIYIYRLGTGGGGEVGALGTRKVEHGSRLCDAGVVRFLYGFRSVGSVRYLQCSLYHGNGRAMYQYIYMLFLEGTRKVGRPFVVKMN